MPRKTIKMFSKGMWWSFVAFLTVAVPRGVFAIGEGDPGGLTNPLKATTLAGFVEDVLTIVRDLGFLVAVFFIVYAGFLFVTARGDGTKLTKAKGAFLWAIVGTAVLLGAWVFATAIKGTVDTLKV